MSHAVLHELLDTGSRYAPEYRGGLSNHLPMALVALHALGAGEDRLRQFFDRYVMRLSLDPAPGRLLADWREELGRRESYADLRATFGLQLSEEGTDATLRAVLPVLIEGVGAAAFHGLIRTAYGVAAGHAGEIASGLAYWACRYLPLRADGAPRPMLGDPQTWLTTMAGELADVRVEGTLIFEQMRAVSQQPAFSRRAQALTIDEATLPALANFAAQRYAATRNFTVLHLVTSCHAMRLLLPYLSQHDTGVGAYSRAYAAGAIASGIALDAPVRPTPPLDWSAIVGRALVSNDEHVIKLVHSCRDEAGVYAGAAHLHAAALAVAR